MWDMMLYGGAPYSRRYRRSRRSSKKGRKCRACKEHIGKVTVGGKKVDMVYCEKHHCQKILANGSVCQEQRNGRNPLWKYCDLREFCPVSSTPLYFFIILLLKNRLGDGDGDGVCCSHGISLY